MSNSAINLIRQSWRLLSSKGARWIISVALLLFILNLVDLSELLQRAGRVKPLWLLASLPLFWLYAYLQAVSLRLYLKRPDLSLSHLTKVSLLAWAWGTLTPSRVGELSSVLYLKKSGVKAVSSSAFVLLSQIITLWLYGMVAYLGLAWILGVNALPILLLACLLAVGFGVGIFCNRLMTRIAMKVLPRSVFVKYVIPLRRAINHINQPGTLISVLLLQACRLLLPFVIFQFMLYAVHADADFGVVTTVNSVARIVSLVPLSIGGLGVRETIQFSLFTEYTALTGEDVIAAAFWSNVLSYGLSLLYLMFIRFSHGPVDERARA